MIQDSFLKSFRETKSPFITNPYRFAAGDVGGWVELGRTTLGSAGASIDVTSLADKRYYMTLVNMPVSGSNVQPRLRLNADSDSNYAMRTSQDGGGDGTSESSSGIIAPDGIYTGNIGFEVFYSANLPTKEKLIQRWHASNRPSTGAGTAPTRKEQVAKWVNTSNAIDQFEINSLSNTFASGAEMVVLGWNPSDTHTDNFWEELYSQELTSTGSLDTGVGGIAAKKYLWIQLHAARSVSGNQGFAFNGDYSNYSARYTTPSESNSTHTSHNLIQLQPDTASTGFVFTNAFIINNASNEKLVIAHTNYNKTTGAGTAPLRLETVGKWANTSDQITDVEIKRDSGTAQFLAGSCMKIWGAD